LDESIELVGDIPWVASLDLASERNVPHPNVADERLDSRNTHSCSIVQNQEKGDWDHQPLREIPGSVSHHTGNPVSRKPTIPKESVRDELTLLDDEAGTEHSVDHAHDDPCH